MTHPDTLQDYLVDLQLDLNFNENKLETADPEAVPVIQRNIAFLKREIELYSEMLRKVQEHTPNRQ